MIQEKRLYKVCITGGPCSGKTTSLAKIVETFSSEFVVYTLPEVATMTFSSGVTIIPTEFTNESHRVFTTAICQMQMDLEKNFEKLAQTHNKKALLICDRGVCDNFAFCSEENRELIMEETGWTKNLLMNERYDMVLHLVTTAIGAEEFYTLENNCARSESKEQSALLDRKLLSIYQEHPNLIVIDNRPGGFPKKIERVLNAMSNLIGAKTPHKYIKKFLLSNDFSERCLPRNLKIEEYVEEHNFLPHNKPNILSWIFKRVSKSTNSPIFIHVRRILEDKFERRIETHMTISEKVYYNFLAQKDYDYAPLKKKVIKFLHEIDNKFYTYIIERIPLKDRTISILRVLRESDFQSEETFIPSFLQTVEEVTENPQYFSINMSKMIE